MRTLKSLFENNKAWAAKMLHGNPEFFATLAKQQAPAYLWIGCSDSRVPANDIVGLLPGELFVHRNVSNLVVPGDVNCHAVLQFAVQSLGVRNIIVCGHYGCGGIRAALDGKVSGLIDRWLSPVRTLHARHETRLARMKEPDRVDAMCELNVVEQVRNVCDSDVVRDAWANNQDLSVHGWIYAIENGLLRDLDVCVTAGDETATACERAVERILTPA